MKRFVSASIALLVPLAILAEATDPANTPEIRGTIQTVHPTAGTVEVLTGVGMALRVVTVETTPSTRIAGGPRGAALERLERGDVVRVLCHPAGKALVADVIERVVTP